MTWLPAAVALVAAWFYGAGLRRLPGRSRRRAIAFYAGVLTALGAVFSPLDALAAEVFSAHMVQHLALIVVAAPLLAYGRPARTILMGLPKDVRRRLEALGRWGPIVGPSGLLRGLPAVWGLHALAVWGWHLPVSYAAALRNETLHAAEHASFLATALAFWWLVVEGPGRLGHLERSLLVFGTALQSGLLGAVLLFASVPLYPVDLLGAPGWGITPLEDQQLAGAIMWVPMGTIYLATMAVLLWRGLRRMEERMPA